MLSLSLLLLSLPQKSPYLKVLAPKQLVNTMNHLHLAKDGLQCALNRGTWPTSITNSAFLLACNIVFSKHYSFGAEEVGHDHVRTKSGRVALYITLYKM